MKENLNTGIAVLALFGCACSSVTSGESDRSSGSGIGGNVGVGSATGIGGATGSGTFVAGGTSATSGVGGAIALGGHPNTGGTSVVGATATGSLPGTGGLKGSGGRAGTGGAGIGGRAIGGARNSGTTGTGGASNPVSVVGGASTGGTKSAGGSRSAGGATSTGGGPSTTVATIVPDPSWTCGMPDGIPDPSSGELVFRATLQLGATHDVGTTQYGHRRILDVKGGSLKGDRVEATFLTGGLDLELTLANGSIELEQINILRTSDGTLIYMRNCGVAAAGDAAVRVVADFEVATTKSLAWLNSGKYVGTRVVDAASGTVKLDVYDVSKVSVAEPKIKLKDPDGVPNVSWDCVTGTGTNGATVFTENVTLGSSISVGASKRGTRNIIPITGGTTTGKVAGAILPGGADYQLSGLDARYTLAPNDGEFILVRNCGAMGGLVPSFEARADGPYAFLNANKFLSSAPGVVGSAVNITFYERK